MAGQDTYTFGNCTWYVAGLYPWVRGGWGNATDWPPAAARQGFQLTMTPTVGAAVAYRAGAHYSLWGHVAGVLQVYGPQSFLVTEMNFVGFDQIDQRVSNMVDVEAFILPPGVQPGSGAGVPLGSGAGAPDQVRVEWSGIQQWLSGGLESQRVRLVRAREIAALVG